MKKIFLSILCGASLFSTGFCQVDDYLPVLEQEKAYFSPSFQSDVDTLVQRSLEAFHVPGIAVGIVIDNQIILSQGYGSRDLEEQLPVTENTLFGIGSCTKAFTCLLLHQLVEEGRISWDDPVVTYIPELHLFNQQLTHEVTIRDLVAHRTGLSRHDTIWYCNDMQNDAVIRCLQHLEPIHGLREKWCYNNFMYSIAGILTERVTGQPWEEVLASRIFTPLGMDSSNVSIEKSLKNSDLSLPYAEIEGVVEKIPFHQLNGIKPAGAINANMVDMLKWIQHLQISSNSLKEMFSMQMPFTANERSELGISHQGYGLGWFISTFKNHPMVHHGGATNGFISDVCLLPEQKIGIVILSNSSTDGIFASNCIKNTLLDYLLETDATDWITYTQEFWKEFKEELAREELYETITPSRPLDDFAGQYHHPAYGPVQIDVQNNQLVATYGDIAIHLHPTDDTIFKGQVRELLRFGIKYFVDFTFDQSQSEKIDQVRISFEPGCPPIIFRAKG